MPTYLFKCLVCNNDFQVVQSMDREHIAFHCDTKAQRVYTVFNTNKDSMYKFTCTAFGKPVEIHSRTQYKKLLKANNAPDATVRECLSVKPKDNTKEKIKKLSTDLKKEIYEKGMMPWCLGKENPKGSDKISEARK